MGSYLLTRLDGMEPPNLTTRFGTNSPCCATCTWMKVIDGKYACGKYGDRLVMGSNVCDDFDSIYEKRGREVLAKIRLKAAADRGV